MNDQAEKMEIRVLGTGCPKCRKTVANAQTAAKQLRLNVAVTLIKDIKEITQWVVFPPGVLVNGKLMSEGYIVPVSMFVGWMRGQGTSSSE